MAMFTPTSNRRAQPAPRPILLAIAAASAVPAALALTVALVGLALTPQASGGPVEGGPTLPTPVATRTVTASPSASPSVTPSPTPTATATANPTATPFLAPTPVSAPAEPRPATPAPPAPRPAADYARPGGIYLDLLTAHRGYGDWYRSLLDTVFMLAADYYPGDLVDTSHAGLNSGYAVRSLLIGDLRAMAVAAQTNGTPIAVVSGFRGHAQQASTFDYWVSVGGYEQALRTSARAGHSEHQLGTTLDFTSAGGNAPWKYADWAKTPAGAWMAANAWRYGFVMSYPAGAFATTGYDYEPWHYRYVGRQIAAEVQASGVPLRQYLWERH